MAGVYYDRAKFRGEIIPGGPEHFKLKLTVTERTIPLCDQRETRVTKFAVLKETFR